MTTPLLRIEDVSVHFPVRKGLLQRQVAEVRAVEQVTLSLNKGEAFGLVGESGCGKTTLARTVLRLVDPTDGTIWFDGQNVTDLKGAALFPYRERVAAIFQDPFSSLNPRQKAGKILTEVLKVHGIWPEYPAPRRGIAGPLRPATPFCRSLSAPDVRWSTSKGGHRARSCTRARVDCL